MNKALNKTPMFIYYLFIYLFIMMANKKGKDKTIWTIRMEVNDPISKTDNRSIEVTLLYINILFLMYRNI